MEPDTQHDEMRKLLLENNRLLQENNEILRTQERRAKWALVGKIIWIIIIIGLPLIALYYLQDVLNNLLTVTAPMQGGGVDINALLEQYGVTPR